MDNPKQKQSEITEAEKHLISELQDGKKSGEESGWVSSDEVREYFRTKEK